MAVQPRYTLKDFEDFAELPENADRLFELINGEITEKVPTIFHSLIVAFLAGHLFMYLQHHPIGLTLIEVRIELADDTGNALIPDLAFVQTIEGRAIEKEKALPFVPDLTVEVLSPKQSPKLMLDKAMYYLSNGGRMVWLVYPEKRLVEVFTQTERHILTIEDTLEGGDVLPGFKIPVKDIFN